MGHTRRDLTDGNRATKMRVSCIVNRLRWPQTALLIDIGQGYSLGTFLTQQGGGPRVVVSTAAFHARVRGSVPGLGGLKETKNVSSPSTCESQYCGEPP